MEERKTLAWRYYEQGRSYNLGLRPSLYTVVNTNIEFFTGNQWLGLPQTRAMAALPKPVFNIIKRVTSLFVAALTSGAVALRFDPLRYYDGENLADPETDASAYATAEVENLFEKFRMDSRVREALFDGAQTGDYCAHFYWDPDAVPYGRIREYFNRAQNAETDFETGQPAYKGKIVFAVSDGNLHTSLSEEPKYDFSRIPQGRLAASFDEADTLVLIYADYKVVGQYTPMVRARKTYTKVCVADLRQDVLYKPFDAVVTDPPRSVTIRTMNGIPMTSAFSSSISIMPPVPHRNRSLARQLAQKKLCLQRLQDINAELKAIDMYLKNHRDNTDLDTLLRTPAYGTLLFEEGFEMYGTMSEELQKWAHEEYEINPKDPELRNVPTVDDIKVRSKSEALIVMLLSVNHIPYRYECRLDVGGHAYYPDFTIRHPVTGEYFYWEHCGKMSDFKYIIKFLNKFRIYILNGYLPDHNLILTFESENHPFDITIAQDKLREFLICKDPFKCA